jgi:hypothetical protein
MFKFLIVSTGLQLVCGQSTSTIKACYA